MRNSGHLEIEPDTARISFYSIRTFLTGLLFGRNGDFLGLFVRRLMARSKLQKDQSKEKGFDFHRITKAVLNTNA